MLKIIPCKIPAQRTTVLTLCTIFNFRITFIITNFFLKVPWNWCMIFNFSNLFSTIPTRIPLPFTAVDRLTAKIIFLAYRPRALILPCTYGPYTLCLLLTCNFTAVLDINFKSWPCLSLQLFDATYKLLLILLACAWEGLTPLCTCFMPFLDNRVNPPSMVII